MLETLAIYGSLVLLVIVLASILGAIGRPERLVFVAGLALFILAHVVVTSPEQLGMGLAVIGVLAAFAATVPMLRQSV